jgi:hypothetical protein
MQAPRLDHNRKPQAASLSVGAPLFCLVQGQLVGLALLVPPYTEYSVKP